MKTLIYFMYSLSLLDFQKDLALMVAIAAIFSSLPAAILSNDLAFATTEEGGGGGDDNGGGGGEPEPDPDPEPEPDPDPEPEPDPDPDPDPDPGLLPGPEPPGDPCEEDPEAEGCEPIDPCIEDPEAEGCEPIDPCIEDPSAEGCEDPCIIDPSLPECVDPCVENPNLEECVDPCEIDPNAEGCEDPCTIDPSSPECDPCLIDPSLPECVGNIYIDIYIINEINNKVRQVKNTPTTCTPQESTVTLGPGSIAAKGVRVLASFDPCILTGGGTVLNLPDSNNNLKLVALDLEEGSTHKAVEVSLQKINTITDDQTFYNAQFTRSMTGMSPITNKVDTIQDINSLVLLNDSPGQIDFASDNSVAFNAVLSPN